MEISERPDLSGQKRIAVLPLGATEQHGPHLPCETDSLIAEAVVSRAVRQLPKSINVDVLPVETVGYSIEHVDFTETQTLDHADAVERWIGIGAEQSRKGIGRFVMLNAHGGNSPLMTIVATELRVHHAMLAVATSWTRFGYPPGLVSDAERAIGIHAGFAETSMMLAIKPELVDMGKARNFPSKQAEWTGEFSHLRAYGPHAFGWKMQDLNPDGAAGNAASATAEAGEKLIEHASRGFAELLIDIDSFDLTQLR
ncbi:MAG: creatininase family protein [Rhizobiaceae bacterium]